MRTILSSPTKLILCSAVLFTAACGGGGPPPPPPPPPILHDWYTYRYDAARTGVQPWASALSDPSKVGTLAVKWAFPGVPAPIAGSPLAGYVDGNDQHVIYIDNTNHVHELYNLASHPGWHENDLTLAAEPKGVGAFKASPIVVNDTVFIGSLDGYFYALDAATGAKKWQYPTPLDKALLGSCTQGGNGSWGSYGIQSSATYARIGGQEAVIFGAPDPDPKTDGGAGSARLFALPLSADPNNPQPIWKSDIVAHVDCSPGSTLHEQIAYSSPLVLRERVYVGIHDAGDDPIHGRLVDDRGNRMSPTHANKKGVRYRYYVSQALLQNRKAEAGSIARIPAPEIESWAMDEEQHPVWDQEPQFLCWKVATWEHACPTPEVLWCAAACAAHGFAVVKTSTSDTLFMLLATISAF